MTAPSVVAQLNEVAKQAMDAYWKSKDLPAAVTLLREGIARGQSAADDARANDARLADEILGTVKAMAFNLASFTWRGWNEPGIVISPEQQAQGREAAELNHRLAVELKRAADKVAVAHWLVGAHALSSGEHDEARRQFALYREMTTDDANRHLADGYTAIANLAAGREAQREFEQAVEQLKALETQDGRFFAEQLMAARSVFVRET